jgi:hypothetical protein
MELGDKTYKEFKARKWGTDSPKDKTERRRWELKKLGFEPLELAMLMHDDKAYRASLKATLESGKATYTDR